MGAASWTSIHADGEELADVVGPVSQSGVAFAADLFVGAEVDVGSGARGARIGRG